MDGKRGIRDNDNHSLFVPMGGWWLRLWVSAGGVFQSTNGEGTEVQTVQLNASETFFPVSLPCLWRSNTKPRAPRSFASSMERACVPPWNNSADASVCVYAQYYSSLRDIVAMILEGFGCSRPRMPCRLTGMGLGAYIALFIVA